MGSTGDSGCRGEALGVDASGRRWSAGTVAGLLGAAALAGAGSLVVTARPSAPSPEEAVEALRASWGDATGVHFSGTVVVTAMIEVPEASTSPAEPAAPRLARVDGRLVMPDRGHWVLDAAGGALEVVVVPGGGYSRRAGSAEQLAGEPWRWVDAPAGGAVSTAGLLAVDAGEPFGFKGFDPAGLGAMVAALGPPERVADGVYRAEVPLSSALDHPHVQGGGLTGHGTAELTLGDGGRRLERMRWQLDVEPESSGGAEDDDREFATGQRVDVDLRFSRWNDAAPVTETRAGPPP